MNNYRREGFKNGRGQSYIAFDFKREQIHIRAKFVAHVSKLPPVLRPLDAELAFDDIASEGIHIKQTVRPEDAGRKEVTVTITCRRPPKFYTPFEMRPEDLDDMPDYAQRRLPYRRRATALDFAISPTVSRIACTLYRMEAYSFPVEREERRSSASDPRGSLCLCEWLCRESCADLI